MSHSSGACSVDGCPNGWIHARGLCRPHYNEARKSEGPKPSVEERFWSYVQKTDTCWLWTGSVNHGYGRFRLSRTREEGAHRVAYRFTRGDIPAHLEIDHLCRVRACVNPDHLELVTPEENIRREVLAIPHWAPNGVSLSGRVWS